MRNIGQELTYQNGQTEYDRLVERVKSRDSQNSKLRCVAYMAIMLCDAINQGADPRTMKDAIDFLSKNAREATNETV